MRKGCLLLLALPMALPVQGMTPDGLTVGYDHADYSAGYGTKKLFLLS